VVILQNVIRPSANKPMSIGVHLDAAQHVVIRIYTQAGKLVKVLQDGIADAGTFEAVWNGANANGQVVRSGVYFIEIQTEHFTDKRKVVVVR
jgi:flagellar hook assembly protein FlgD